MLSTSEAIAAIGTGQAPVSDEVKAMLAQYTTAIGESSRRQVSIDVPLTSLQKMAEMVRFHYHCYLYGCLANDV